MGREVRCKAPLVYRGAGIWHVGPEGVAVELRLRDLLAAPCSAREPSVGWAMGEEVHRGGCLQRTR